MERNLITEAEMARLRAIFEGDRYATGTTGIEIAEAAPGYAKVRLALDERHYNAAGRVMGAVYYTMADFAYAVASNVEAVLHTGEGEQPRLSVTLTSAVSFLTGARGSILYAESEPVREGRRVLFYRTRVTDDLGTLVAEVQAGGYRP
jgi:acyl-CoA thioesterase